MEVVGVAGNVKHFSLEEEPLPTLYAPIPQVKGNDFAALRNSLFLAIRAEKDVAVLTDEIRRRLRALDPNAPASAARTAEQMLHALIGPRRFTTQVMVFLALVTVGLGAMGLFGVMAYLVENTRREIGVRMALGALPSRILKRTVGEGALLAGAGIVLGLVLAFAVRRLVTGALFQVSTAEPTTVVTAVFLVTIMLMAASYVPARRAARTDPNEVLRGE